MSTKKIIALLTRREALLKELGALNAQIVRLAVETGESSIAAASAAVPGRGRSARGAAASSRRKWFERGEMLRLTRKLITEPMAQADIVRALAAAKGYDKSLSDEDRARFSSAAYQAIAAAINARQLTRNRAGQVAVRR